MVRQSGFRIVWARLVTTSVESRPVPPAPIKFYSRECFFLIRVAVELSQILVVIRYVVTQSTNRAQGPPLTLDEGTVQRRTQRSGRFEPPSTIHCCLASTTTDRSSNSCHCRHRSACRDCRRVRTVAVRSCTPFAIADTPRLSPYRPLWHGHFEPDWPTGCRQCIWWINNR